jgi:hypothetical protein
MADGLRKQKADARRKAAVNVKQYVTDRKGQKVAAILDMEELERVEEMLEDLSDLKAIEERKGEPVEDYEAYSRKRKSRLNVPAGH